MNLFRISVLVFTLALVAGTIVHIRLQNWHCAYRINQLYDKHQRLQREYWQSRLELARYQSPDHLLERLKELKLPLQGFGLPDQEKTETTKPSKDKPTAKPSAKQPSATPHPTAKPKSTR